MARRWTHARQHALRVFTTGHITGKPIRRANESTVLGAWNGEDSLTCAWQSFDWFQAEGLTQTSVAGSANGSELGAAWARLSAAGVEVARRNLPGMFP